MLPIGLLIDVTIPPIIDWQPGYVGDPNNILAATSPDYTNSDGIKFFKKTVTVGNDANYASLRDAIEALKNEFGPDGGGKKYAINILNGFNQAKMNQTHIVGDDLSWISIFSVNNYEVIFDTGGNQNLTGAFVLHCRVAPIFNFKFQRNGQILPPNTNCIFYLSDDAPDTVTIMLGSNTEINFQSMQYYPQGNPFNYPSSVFGSSGYKSLNLQAQNGFKLYSPHFLLAYIVGFKCFINNASFYHTGTDRYIFGAFAGSAIDYDITMYNSTFFFNNKQAGEKELSYGGIFLASNKQNNTPCLFQNVTNTQRTHTMVGIRTQNQNVTLDHCNFSGQGEDGYDIYVFGQTEDNKIYLKDTTGKTNQTKNIATNKGLIKEII